MLSDREHDLVELIIRLRKFNGYVHKYENSLALGRIKLRREQLASRVRTYAKYEWQRAIVYANEL